MSIAQTISRLQSVNSILRSCGNGALSFDDALTLAAFYRDYSDTNGLIESAEKEAAEDADRLLTDTISLLPEIEKFSAVDYHLLYSNEYALDKTTLSFY